MRAMSPEQIFDSLAQATGRFTFFDPEQPLNFSNDPTRQEFLETFTNDSESTVERQSTILQALTLMNGRVTTRATDVKNSETLSAVADAPFMDTAAKLEVLYLSALSRKPTAKELSRMSAHVEKGGAEALADVFWVLLNSGEFILNH